MKTYRVSVTRTVQTNGWVTVMAYDDSEAFAMVEDMRGEEIEDSAEWGSCGDMDEYDVQDYVELVIEPTVSEGLWA